MSKIRIEYVRLRRGGDEGGFDPSVIVQVVAPSVEVTVGAALATLATAPAFPADRQFSGGVFARLIAIEGAAAVSVGADAARSVLVDPSTPVHLPIAAGDVIKGVAAVAPSAVSYIDAGGYPAGASPLQNSSGNKAAAIASATLVPGPGARVYVTGLTATYGGSTAGGQADLTVTGLLGGTLTYSLTIPVGALVPGQPLALSFVPPLPAADIDTNVLATMPSLGAGNLCSGVTLRGYSF